MDIKALTHAVIVALVKALPVIVACAACAFVASTLLQILIFVLGLACAERYEVQLRSAAVTTLSWVAIKADSLRARIA